MKPRSAKAKGRKFQQEVRDMILERFPDLTADDVRSTSMGAGGEDIQLSTAARRLLPIQIECKSKSKSAIHTMYDQALEHGDYTAVLIVKKNHAEPLAIIPAEWFFDLMRKINGNL